VRSARSILNKSTARDDAPNAARDGNGLCATNIPGGVINVIEGGSVRPNGLEEEFRISPLP
jgi:hypothetical protein